MNVLLVGPKIGFPPVALALISAVLKGAGHVVTCMARSNVSAIKETLACRRFDLLATGGLSVHVPFFRDVINLGKAAGVPTLLGGGVITSDPEFIMERLRPDFGIIGEGEVTVLELLEALEKKGDLSVVNGLVFFRNGNLVRTGARLPISSLDALPHPDWENTDFEDFLGSSKPSDSLGLDVFDYPRMYPLVAARSCPFNCTFCYHPLGQKYRQRTLDSLFQELERMIVRFRINIVAIYDELFSVHPDRLMEFSRRFSELRARVPWEILWNCQIRVNNLSEEILQTMAVSGCYMISFGLESYHQIVLDSMRKQISPGEISRAIELTRKFPLILQGNFIFGDVAETLETARTTLHFWRRNRRLGINLIPLLMFPNSEIFQICVRKGIIGEKMDFLENHLYDVYNVTSLTDADFMTMRMEILRHNLLYLPRAYPEEVGESRLSVNCPHCSRHNRFENFDPFFGNSFVPYFLKPSRLFFNKMVFCRTCRGKFWATTRWYVLFARIACLLLQPYLYLLWCQIKGSAGTFAMHRLLGEKTQK